MFSRKKQSFQPPSDRSALILSGGGARGAYQAGVLKAVAELHEQAYPGQDEWPFKIVTGTSCGAINAAYLAQHEGSFFKATQALVDLWQGLEVHNIYDANGWAVVSGLTSLGRSLITGKRRENSVSIFNNDPLRKLIKREINFSNIQKNIDSGRLHALAITAMGYSTGESVSFYQGSSTIEPWQRFRRVGVPAKLHSEHLMASTAIPSVFPAIKIDREYFGDGAMRQFAPLSPALNTGATKLFVVGVSDNRNPKRRLERKRIYHSPSMAQIAGHLFNSTFIDGLEGDLERMSTINGLLERLSDEHRHEVQDRLKPIANLCISPSQGLEAIAEDHFDDLPRSMRAFFWLTGASNRGGGAAAGSFLLFEHGFISDLINLGYQDAMWEQDAILAFFGAPTDAEEGA